MAVGDEVIAYRVDGGYAEELVAAASAVVPKPATLGWEAAGGLLLAGATAVHTLTAADVQTGETVLVHAAAGGVGLLVVQLAAIRGARVIATASERNHEYLRRLGAEPTTYGDGLAERVRALAPDGVDAAIDCIGSDEAIDVSLQLVADRERIVTIVGSARVAETGIKLLGGGPGADPGTAIRDAARLELTALAEQGKLELRTRAFALDDVAAAHREGDAVQREEDLLAGAVAAYLVLLAAHGRGLAGYWRTVPFLDSPAAREALALDALELPIGLLHLGAPRQEQRVPERAPASAFVRYTP